MPEQSLPTDKPDEFQTAFGEPIAGVLDMQTWRDGADLATLYDALRQAVAESVAQEQRVREPIRQLLFARLRAGTDRYAPPNAGVYQLTPEQIQETHCGLLFNGATEACDGTVAAHDSLLLSVTQVGLALVSYQGNQHTWVQRLYRRDLREQFDSPVAEAVALLERRERRDATEDDALREPFSRLVRRALMEYAERAALTHLSSAIWRMGHGHPVPINLLVPTSPALVRAALATLRTLLLEHRRFVFVTSAPVDRLLLTIGDALEPLQYAIVDTLARHFTENRLGELRQSQSGHPAERDLIQEFLRDARLEIVTGVYRAGPGAPPRVFYAHKEFAHQAAAVAIADSTLLPHRGFPMLIDLADIVAGNTFDSGSFTGMLQDAYAAAGEPTRYLGERETRQQ